MFLAALRSRGPLKRLFGWNSNASRIDLESQIEHIRQSMLSALGDNGCGQFPRIAYRVRHANEIRDLWYLRGELMGALSRMHGEGAALETIFAISEEFEGLLPGGFSSRPSPLAG